MARRSFDPGLIQAPPEETFPRSGGLLTVSQVTALVRQAIETALPPTLHVVGEISNFKRHSSGHLYFTVKDLHSELSCVMWRSHAAALKFKPADGMEVIATGRIEVFERAGRYQLYVRRLEPRGIGALELAFQQLCEKLSGEGLFDAGHKRPLPRYPQRIAVVTSPTGAVINDIIRAITRRYPSVHVLLYPVRVQGPGAAEEIAAAIRRINANSAALGEVDMMIVGRGGGSLEDLWTFNEEVVARAIFSSRIPIISAVGHEVDVTIADLVADVRAATPTAAAELAVPVRDELLADLDAHGLRLRRTVRARLELFYARLTGLLQRRGWREPHSMVRHREQRIDEMTLRLHRRAVERCTAARRRIEQLTPVIDRIAPHAAWLRASIGLANVRHRLTQVLQDRLRNADRALDRPLQRLERSAPAHRVRRLGDRLGRDETALGAAWRFRLSLAGEQVRRHEERLSAMSYKSVIRRGFSLTRTAKGRKVVRFVGQVSDRQRLITEVADGEFQSEVVNLTQLELFEP